MDQLQLVGRRACGRNGFIDDLHRFFLPQAMQVYFYKRFTQM
jgi:hypothetical protein